MSYKMGLSVGADLTVTSLASKAGAAEAKALAPSNVIAVHRDGIQVQTFGYPTRAEANAKYDELTTRPGDIAYVAVFDRTDTGKARPEAVEPYDSAYFVATEQLTAHTRSQSIAGWVAAFIAGLFGLAVVKKGKR